MVIMNSMADTELEELFHAGSNKLTAKMFSEVAKDKSEESFVISAFSVMIPLAQLALSSVGPSHDELLNAIGLPNDNITKSVFSSLDTHLKSIQGAELKTATKIYVALRYKLNPEFTGMLNEVFHSEVSSVDFSENEKTAKTINDWIEDQTNHRIKDLIDPASVGPATTAILVNALYFKGFWNILFSESSTEDKDFHISKEKVVKVPMMNNNADYKYGESESLKSKFIEIPYEGDSSSMLIILPDEVEGIKKLLEELEDFSVLDEVYHNMNEINVDLTIPKFKIETTTNLKDILKIINVTKIFSPETAKLDMLTTNAMNDIYISDAVQKAFIEINEQGAEAGAANSIDFKDGFPLATFKYQFLADHPFIFFLKERNNIMFSGIYYA